MENMNNEDGPDVIFKLSHPKLKLDITRISAQKLNDDLMVQS